MTTTAFAFGLGVGTQNSVGEWLEVFYPQPLLAPSGGLVEAVANFGSGETLGASQLAALQGALDTVGETGQAELAAQLQDSKCPVVAVLLNEDTGPASVPEAYLKLHLLSHRLVKPQGTNLDGLFAVLPNVAWTNEGAIAIAELAENRSGASSKTVWPLSRKSWYSATWSERRSASESKIPPAIRNRVAPIAVRPSSRF